MPSFSTVKDKMMTRDPFSHFRRVLKKSARSFYLSLMIFPSILKKQIAVAYFFCKTADTIVDLSHFAQKDRGKILNHFYEVLNGSLSLNDFMKIVESRKLTKIEEPLFQVIQSALILFRHFSSGDQKLILDLFREVKLGMEIDLKGEPLKNEKELDQYCFHVAGSAGVFLTDLFYQNQFFHKPREEMISLGILLGKGLQLTNILRDQAEDLRRNRIYLPSGADFSSGPDIYIKTLSYLENGMKYVIFLPRRSWRIRLASLWPLLFALKTLSKLINSSSKFSGKIKIRRFEIYTTLIASILFVFSNNGIRSYFESIRKKINPVEGIRK